jgi:hypothetical protein
LRIELYLADISSSIDKEKIMTIVKCAALAATVFTGLLLVDGSRQPAEAQNLLGPVFTPHLYGMRPPRADNSRIREQTAPSKPPKGHSSWADYYAAQSRRFKTCQVDQFGNRSACY